MKIGPQFHWTESVLFHFAHHSQQIPQSQACRHKCIMGNTSKLHDKYPEEVWINHTQACQCSDGLTLLMDHTASHADPLSIIGTATCAALVHVHTTTHVYRGIWLMMAGADIFWKSLEKWHRIIFSISCRWHRWASNSFLIDAETEHTQWHVCVFCFWLDRHVLEVRAEMFVEPCLCAPVCGLLLSFANVLRRCPTLRQVCVFVSGIRPCYWLIYASLPLLCCLFE